MVLGVLCLLGGLVALGLVLTDSMNYSAVGDAKKGAGIGIGVGLAAIIGAVMMKKQK
jgi:hypothetical protein